MKYIFTKAYLKYKQLSSYKQTSVCYHIGWCFQSFMNAPWRHTKTLKLTKKSAMASVWGDYFLLRCNTLGLYYWRYSLQCTMEEEDNQCHRRSTYFLIFPNGRVMYSKTAKYLPKTYKSDAKFYFLFEENLYSGKQIP